MHNFTTERLLIRPLAEQDKSMYVSLYTDAKTMRNIAEPLTELAAEKAFNKTISIMQQKKPKVITWAIVNLASNKNMGLQALNWQSPDIAEIGIMLLRHTNGRLIPEEAMGALMEYAFNNLSINIIKASYAKRNLATKRFVKKLGFISKSASSLENSNNCYEYFNKEQWHQKLIIYKGK